MELLKLYFKLARASIKGQLSYKKDFYIQMVVWSIYTIVPFFAINLIFVRFGLYSDNMRNQLILMYGVFLVGYDSARMLARGFDSFQKLVFRGDLDIYYIRPLPIIYQIIANDVFIRRLAGIIQGIFLIIIAIFLISSARFISIILFVIVIIICLFIMYVGFMIMSSSVFFISIAPSNALSFFVESSKEFGYLPFELLRKPVKLIFLYIIPIYYIVYEPITSFILERGNFLYKLIVPVLLSLAILLLSVLLFRLLSKRYISTNN